MRYLRLFLGLAAFSWTQALHAQTPRNVTEALTQHKWLWTGGNYQNIPLTFSLDGLMTVQWGDPSQITSWKWRLHDDPNKLIITKQNSSSMEVQFDPTYATFEGVSDKGKRNAGVRVITSPPNMPAPARGPQTPPAAPIPPTPQALADLTQRLQNTQWKFVHKQDYLQTGGAIVIKDGAWMVIRLRSNGRYSAWHHDKIAHEAKWEAVDANLIRLQDSGPDSRVGLLLKLDASLTSFAAQNDENVSGAFMSKLGPVDKIVGRWHWDGPGTVHFREDGMCFAEWPNGESGTWRSSGNDRYEANWANGKYVDKVRMKSGDKELACEGLDGRKFGAHRVVPK